MVHGNLVYFSHFGILYEEKSGNPGQTSNVCKTVSFTPVEKNEIGD
jgi:hypothetical protein